MRPEPKPDTTSEAFFEAKYSAAADPWHFATSPYEQTRYTAIFNALQHRRYQRAFEPGCSVGLLTQRLATLCDRVDATDISPTAVEQAARRCAHLPNVHTTCGALPALIPHGSFDLIVFSEIGYYFDEPSLHDLAAQLVHRLTTGGTLLAAHWLGTSSDHLLSGDRVHEILKGLPHLALEQTERHESSEHGGFRLERFRRD